MEPPQVAALGIALVAVITLFALASYEATFIILSRSSLERLHENQVARAKYLLRVYEPRHRLQILVRTGQLICTIVLTLALSRFIGPFFADGLWYATLCTGGIAALFLLSTAPARRVRLVDEGEDVKIPFSALVFVPLHILLLPLTNLMDHLVSRHNSPEDVKADKEDELRNIVESEGETGVLEEGEKEMIEGVFGFHDSVVREVMVPRVDIKAVEQNVTVENLIQTIKDTGHSRLPVYDETLDRIRGMVYAKDLLQLIVAREGLPLSTPLLELVGAEVDGTPFFHPPYYVPETKKIDELLHDLRGARTRLAIVLDEYGGTAGLVTTEDLVEEIVGEIQDEYDDEQALYHWNESQDCLVVNPRINIEDLNEVLESDLPKDDFDTLGGFIYDHLGQVPAADQTFDKYGFEFKILDVEGQRISQVQIRRLSSNGSSSDAA